MILEIYSLFVMNYIYNPMGKNLQYQDFETRKTRYQDSVTKTPERPDSKTKTSRHCDSRTSEPRSSFQDKKTPQRSDSKTKKNLASWRPKTKSYEVIRKRRTISTANLRRISNFIASLYLYKSTIRPCMESCCHVWACAPSYYLELLDKLQKRICMNVGPDCWYRTKNLLFNK